MTRGPRFVVVGAGMAGILSAVKLAEAGFDDVTVYEKADRLGGTWRENTYPGVACDVPSHLYSYSFAPNSELSHTFSPGPEIYAYLEDVARRFGAVVVDAPQRGFGAAAAAGLAAADADVVCFCDADASLDPQQLPLVTGPVLAGLYGRARLVAYVPLLEGFGLPAVEAMYACAPVVASPMPSTGGAAFEVDPRDTDAIADALVQVAGQEGVRSQLVTAGVLRSSELTWVAAAGRHVELWSEVPSE